MSSRAWLVSLVSSLLIFFASSGAIIMRIKAEQLWGHLALFQLSSAWLLFMLIVARKALRSPSVFHNFLLGSTSAIFLSVGFPPFPLPILLFIGFVPLLLSLDRCKRFSFRARFLLLYHTFILWNIFSTFWVANTAYAAGIFANTVNALLMTLPVFTFLFIRKKLGEPIGLAAFVTTWIAFEFLHMHWDLYWPWLTLGNGLATMHAGIQWYDYTGVFGGSLWILVANYLFYQLVQRDSKKVTRLRMGLWLLIPLLISLIRYNRPHDSIGSIEVVAVQPNFEPHFEKFRVPTTAVSQRMLNLATPLISGETDYLVMPETSFSGIDMDRISESGYFPEFTNLLEDFPHLKIVSGLGAHRFLSREEDINRPTTRALNSQGQTYYIEQYNAAMQLESGGEVQEYYKALYVPGAEFFPFQRVLFFLQPIIDQLGGTNHGYRIKDKFGTFKSDVATVGPPICYESIFGEFINHFIKRGAQTIFIMTNDGWWDNTAGHRQHAQYAKLRSIETRRSIARSANMGTTCFINTRGDLSQPTVYGEAEAIKGEISLNDQITFYVRWGDVIGRLSVFIAALLALRAIVVGLKKKGY